MVVAIVAMGLVAVLSLYGDGAGQLTQLVYGEHVADTFGLHSTDGGYAGCPASLDVPPDGFTVPIELNGRLSQAGSTMAASVSTATVLSTLSEADARAFASGGPSIYWLPAGSVAPPSGGTTSVAFVGFRCAGSGAIVATGLRRDPRFPLRLSGLTVYSIDLPPSIVDQIRSVFPQLPRTFHSSGGL